MLDIGLAKDGVPSRGWQTWIICTVMVVIAGIFVTIRLIARHLRTGIQIDDWTTLAALIASTLFTVVHDLAVEHGFGKHEWDVPDDSKITALKYILVGQVIYKIAIGFAKISILLLYLRIFYVQKHFRWACIGFVVFTILSSIAYIPPSIWQCSPVASFWDRSIPHTCINNHASWLSYALINILTDVFILLLPIHQILRLQLNRRDKIGLIFVFGLGAFVCVTTIIRATSLAASSKTKDVTWNTVPVSTWSSIEINTGIICACMPMIRQPLAMLFPRFFSTSTLSRSKHHTGTYGRSSRHRSRKTQNDTVPISNNNLPWTCHTNEENNFSTSVTPGRKHSLVRTESEERMINMDSLDASGHGIMKRMDVSISESPA